MISRLIKSNVLNERNYVTSFDKRNLYNLKVIAQLAN